MTYEGIYDKYSRACLSWLNTTVKWQKCLRTLSSASSRTKLPGIIFERNQWQKNHPTSPRKYWPEENSLKGDMSDAIGGCPYNFFSLIPAPYGMNSTKKPPPSTHHDHIGKAITLKLSHNCFTVSKFHFFRKHDWLNHPVYAVSPCPATNLGGTLALCSLLG